VELFFQLMKADFAGEFTGVMCALEPDHDREIINWDGTKKAVLDWSTDQANASQQKSWGNIRAQHQDSQVIGKLTAPPEIDERNKRIIVHGKVVDPVAKDMLQEGCYTGLSIGGAYASKRPLPNGLTEYVPKLSELSLVDKPCSPSALLTVTRADGSVMQKHFKPSTDPRVNPNACVAKAYGRIFDSPGDTPFERLLHRENYRKAIAAGMFRKPHVENGPRVSPNQRRANEGLPFADISSGAAGSYARYHGATPDNLDDNADANRSGVSVERSR
jgi:hypothetical protein